MAKIPDQLRNLLNRFLKFSVIGALTSLLYTLLVFVALEFTEVSATAASFWSYVLSVPANYLANRYITFQSKASPKFEFSRFLIVHGINAAVATGVMWLVAEKLGRNPTIGILLVVVAIPVISFVVMNVWVFRSR